MKVKLLLMTGMLLAATTASAQFVSVHQEQHPEEMSNYGSLYFQYNPQTLKFDVPSVGDITDFHGLLFGFKNGFGLSKSVPLYLEAGLTFQYMFFNNDEKDTDTIFCDELNLVTLSVPLNLTYKFTLPDSKVSIMPYLGLTMRFHLSGNAKDRVAYEELNYYGYGYGNGSYTYYKDCDYSLFDNNDMNGDAANRFQFAWQLGANICFNKVYLGVGYGSDLSEFLKKTKFGTTYFTLGVMFDD